MLRQSGILSTISNKRRPTLEVERKACLTAATAPSPSKPRIFPGTTILDAITVTQSGCFMNYSGISSKALARILMKDWRSSESGWGVESHESARAAAERKLEDEDGVGSVPRILARAFSAPSTRYLHLSLFLPTSATSPELRAREHTPRPKGEASLQ